MTTSAAEPPKTLPPRRAAFVREYLVDLNASRAARDAGYAARSASVEGSTLLAKADEEEETTGRGAILPEPLDVISDGIIRELAAAAL